MPKVSPIQTSMNAGEWSPTMYGRPDIEKYKNALTTSLNAIGLIQGPWTRRPGTKFVNQCKNHGEACYLYPFEFGVTQAYCLVFGPLYMRVIRNGSLVTQTAQNITGITKANPAVVTYAGADTYANGDRVIITGVVGMSQVNNREFIVANVNAGANTFELQDSSATNVNSTNYDAYTSGGTVAEIYELVTPYAEADLFQLRMVQSADVLYVAHPTYAPRKITRTAHTSWSITAISFQDGPYLPINTTTTTLTLGATSGATTLTASANLFASTDVGRLVRWKDPAGNWTWGTITGYTSATVVDFTIAGPNASATTATVSWRLGVWSATTGYPAACTFFEDRLCFGGPTSYPQRIDCSVSGSYENFAPSDVDGTVADDNAVAVSLNSNDVNVIRWMANDERALLAGTAGGEWIIRPSTNSEALSPTNVAAKQSTQKGSANLPGVKAGKAVLFVQRTGNKLRELAYVYEVDGFRAPDMNVYADHMLLGGVKDLTYMAEPHSILWVARNDGALMAFVYERDQEVIGWHKCLLGGSFGSGDAVVESVAAIPSSDGTRDELFVVVKRTINGSTVRYIEQMQPFDRSDIDQSDLIFVDSALTYDSTATATISGLWHLEGEEVEILADGAGHPNVTVTNGKITLDRAASTVQVGLASVCRGASLRFEAGAADGTAQGKTQRHHRVIFRLLRTLGFRAGPSFDDLYQPSLRTSANNTDEAVPLFTGDKEVPWEGGYSTDELIYWDVNGPFPCTVQAIMPQLHTQDR